MSEIGFKEKTLLGFGAAAVGVIGDATLNVGQLIENRRFNEGIEGSYRDLLLNSTSDASVNVADGLRPENLIDLHTQQFNSVFPSANDNMSSFAESAKDGISSIGGYASDAFNYIKDVSLTMWGNDASQVIDSISHNVSNTVDAAVSTMSSGDLNALSMVAGAVAGVAIWKLAGKAIHSMGGADNSMGHDACVADEGMDKGAEGYASEPMVLSPCNGMK